MLATASMRTTIPSVCQWLEWRRRWRTEIGMYPAIMDYIRNT
jgi:hypothetical protein